MGLLLVLVGVLWGVLGTKLVNVVVEGQDGKVEEIMGTLESLLNTTSYSTSSLNIYILLQKNSQN